MKAWAPFHLLVEKYTRFDEWVIDNCAQPAVNRLADVGIKRDVIGGTLLRLSVVPLIGPTVLDVIAQQSPPDVGQAITLAGGMLTAYFCSLIVRLHRSVSDSSFLRPFGYRATWAARAFWILDALALGWFNSMTMNAFIVLMLSGLYVLATRKRPPSRRVAKAPGGATVLGR